jgi:hypothetical protein
MITDHQLDKLWAECFRRPEEVPDPLIDLNAHLEDIVKDVARVKKAANEDGVFPKITPDEFKSRLSDISNALDDLYNEIRGI